MNKITFFLTMSLCVSCNYYENASNDNQSNVAEMLKSSFDTILHVDEKNEQRNNENTIMSNMYINVESFTIADNNNLTFTKNSILSNQEILPIMYIDCDLPDVRTPIADITDDYIIEVGNSMIIHNVDGTIDHNLDLKSYKMHEPQNYCIIDENLMLFITDDLDKLYFYSINEKIVINTIDINVKFKELAYPYVKIEGIYEKSIYIRYIDVDTGYLYYKLDILNGKLTEINLDDIPLEFRDISIVYKDTFKKDKNVFLVNVEGIDDERFILEIWDEDYTSQIYVYNRELNEYTLILENARYVGKNGKGIYVINNECNDDYEMWLYLYELE